MKGDRYREIRNRLEALVEGETDEIALMATVACELHLGLKHFHWTGFYRVVEPGLLKIGPYQGTHGCLVIPFERGVCGKCARDAKLVRVDDVETFPGHIACSSTTRSEIVVPVIDRNGRLRAVLDVDSDLPAAFDETDEAELTAICALIGRQIA
jgi:GAF domain-containing protein